VAAGGRAGGAEHGYWAAVALALAVYARTGSAVWLSGQLLVTQVPSALAAPLPGLIAGRPDGKGTMIICDLPGAAANAAMAVTGSPLGSITPGALAALLHSTPGRPRGRPSRTWPGR
jgi:1,4-dihydroxy-2-naphthoyl-CoA synthase